MNVYFASSPSSIHIRVLRESGVRNLLFSYAFIKNPNKLASLLEDYLPERIILDSGAFSVWSKGDTIDIDKYASFALEFQKLIDPSIKLYVVNLDVLPGKWGEVPTKEEIAKSAEQGWQNMLYLESKGLKVIHIFHQHEDFSILERLIAHSDYIGISPANDLSMDEKMQWMDKCFAQIGKNRIQRVKTHGFAVTSYKQLYKYPFYSVDSSSWVAAARFGQLAVFTDSRIVRVVKYKDKDNVQNFWKYLSSVGIHKIADSLDWTTRVKVSIKAYLLLAKSATDLWTSRGIVWDNESVDNSVVLSHQTTILKE